MKSPTFTHIIGNRSIRTKLLLGYSTAFIMFFAATAYVIYPTMQDAIEKNAESELRNSTKTILSMIQTTSDASMKNYLRAAAEKNKDIVEGLFAQYRRGELSQEDAKRLASKVLLSERIGETGYFYCVDGSGVLQVHPFPTLVSTDVSRYDFVKEQLRKKEGYVEYEWRNPGEASERMKAIYMTYFKPWDWIISASAYRDEFSQLVNIENFRKEILSLQFGKTGYTYILNSNGDVIVHPTLSGNVSNTTDSQGRPFIQEICKLKSGKIVYDWQGPNDSAPREKLVVFGYIPAFDWIVVSSCYSDEIYSPLKSIRQAMIFAFIASLVFVVGLTAAYSSYFTRNFKKIIRGFHSGAKGDFSVRIVRASKDEFGRLADYFNEFMAKLDSYNQSLRQEIAERRQTEETLQKRNEDLERFEKLVVGRELKMVELKKQIADLEEQITIMGR